MGIIKPMLRHQGKGGGKASTFRPSFGGGKGKGGKGNKGGGQWVFMPTAAPMKVIQHAVGKFGGGKSFGKGGKGKGGKGKESQYRFMDKLDTIDADRKVWVGGLPEDCTRGNIVEHFKPVSPPGVFEILRKGTACISFKTAEDAETVISSLNESELGGKNIQVDVWTKKEKKERPEGEKREKRKRPEVKNKAGKPADSKMKLKMKAIDHSLKVWIGGLSTSTTWKQIKQHFADNGHEAEHCDLMKPGTACVSFKTEDEATNAISSINGTDLDGNSIEVDTWQKPQKREKKTKED